MTNEALTFAGILGSCFAAIGVMWQHLTKKQEAIEQRNHERQIQTEQLLTEQQKTAQQLLCEQLQKTENRLETSETNYKDVSFKYTEMSLTVASMEGRLAGHAEARQDLGELGALSAETIEWMRITQEEARGG